MATIVHHTLKHPRRSQRSLLAVALAMLAPRPAARPTLAFLQLFAGATDPPFSSLVLLGVLDPADGLVAGTSISAELGLAG